MDFHKFSVFIKSAHQNRFCPPYNFFFIQKKKSQISNSYFVSSLSDFFYISNDTNLSQLLPKKTNYIPFLYDLPNQYKKLLFLLFVKPNSFFFSKKISPCAQLLQ